MDSLPAKTNVLGQRLSLESHISHWANTLLLNKVLRQKQHAIDLAFILGESLSICQQLNCNLPISNWEDQWKPLSSLQQAISKGQVQFMVLLNGSSKTTMT